MLERSRWLRLPANGIVDRHYFVTFLARGQPHDPLVPDFRADQGSSDGRAPPDLAGRSVGFVVTDDGQGTAVAVLVGEFDRGAEADLVARGLRGGIDHLRRV